MIPAVALLAILAVPVAMAGDVAAGDVAAGTPETTTEIVAAAVRDRGYACAHPSAVAPDPKASLPDRTAWTIHCEQGAFTVIFEGDTGARVTRLP